MANEEHMEIIQQGTAAWNAWRKEHQMLKPNLSDTDLRNANLSGANLSGANLNDATFSAADLNNANLSGASLRSINLRNANLSGADLSRANFIFANLSGANLSGATLWRAALDYASLIGTNLSHANLTDAKVIWTVFGNVDLQLVNGLETVRHLGPSIISVDTLERSRGNIPEVFLRQAGVSDNIIVYARSLVAKPIEYYTCFISYSQKDQAFTERLYNDLQGKGVRCWYAPKELKPGDFYRYKIDESIRMYDKLLLVLSEHSIKSAWVEEEAEGAWKKEEQMDMRKQVLFPLRIDDAVMHTKRRWAATTRLLRQIADFTGWKDHDTYQRAFERLLRDLQSDGTTKD